LVPRARQSGPRWPKSPPLMTSLTKNPHPPSKKLFFECQLCIFYTDVNAWSVYAYMAETWTVFQIQSLTVPNVENKILLQKPLFMCYSDYQMSKMRSCQFFFQVLEEINKELELLRDQANNEVKDLKRTCSMLEKRWEVNSYSSCFLQIETLSPTWCTEQTVVIHMRSCSMQIFGDSDYPTHILLRMQICVVILFYRGHVICRKADSHTGVKKMVVTEFSVLTSQSFIFVCKK